MPLERLLLLLLALVAAAGVRRLLARRRVDATGLEALVAGLLLGPVALLHGELYEPVDALLHDLKPLMSFAIGAAGLSAGLHLRVAALRARPRESVRITNIVALTTGALVSVVMAALLWWGGAPDAVSVPATAIVAAAALLAAPDAVAAARRQAGASGPVTDLLEHVAGYSQVYGIIIFGLATSFIHVGDAAVLGRTLVPVEWAALNIGAGAAIGLLFSWFLGAQLQSDDTLIVIFLGMLLFGAGLSLALNLSPLLTGLAIGATVVNTTPAHQALTTLATRLQAAVFIVLVFFTAVVWRWPLPLIWALVPAFLVARLLGRWLGARAAALACPSRDRRPIRALGIPLLGMSAFSLAIALSTWQIYGGDSLVTQIVVTCLVVAGPISELPGRRALRNVLIDAGEVGSPGAPVLPEEAE